MAVVKGEARKLILDTAEALFADRGVEAVSLRNINAAAGVSPGVLHYHFGSREVLVHELISRHMAGLMAEREHMLEPLLAQDRPTVTDIVRSLVVPLARLNLEGGEDGARYVRFIARLYGDRSALLEEIGERYRHVNQHYPVLLQRALPNRSPADIDLKFAMANHAMLHTLSDLESAGPTAPGETLPGRRWLGRALKEADNDSITAALIEFISNGIASNEDKP